MKQFWVILLGLCVSTSVISQMPDRKIIVEDGTHFCVTIDERFQIGTLHAGDVDDTLLTGEKLALPAGRSLLYGDKPLSWDLDLENEFVYAVSFLDHPLNDRNEAIKRILFDQLTPWTQDTRPEAVIMHSVDNNMYAFNDPYKFAVSRSIYMDSFYFDAVAHKGSYWMVIVHNGEWHSWNFADGSWQHSEVSKAQKSGYFSLFSFNDDLKLLANDGSVYHVSLEGIHLEKEGRKDLHIQDGIIVEDRDNDKILLLDKAHLDKDLPFGQLMNEFATTIYE